MLERSVDKLSALSENEIYKRNLEAIVEGRIQTVLNLQHKQVQNYQYAIHSLVKMIEERERLTLAVIVSA